MERFQQRWIALTKSGKDDLCQSLRCDRSHLSKIAHGLKPSFVTARCIAFDLDSTVDALFPNVFFMTATGTDAAPLFVGPSVSPSAEQQYVTTGA